MLAPAAFFGSRQGLQLGIRRAEVGGHIGQHLVDACARRGLRVEVVDGIRRSSARKALIAGWCFRPKSRAIVECRRRGAGRR